MAELKDLGAVIKIPEVKWLTYVITAGVLVFIVSKVYGTIVQGQVMAQQKKINTFILADYTAKYSEKSKAA